jgi:hypothetical protein
VRRAEFPKVITDKVTDVGVDPVRFTELEDSEQVEPVGAPAQLSVTAWLKPAIGVTAIV